MRSLGAQVVIDHSRPLSEALQDAGLAEVNYVISLNHTDQHFDEIVKALKPQGKLALIDDPDLIDVRQLKRKSLSLHWEFMFTRPMFNTADIQAQHRLLEEVAALIDAGKLRTTLNEELGVINAANLRHAHALIEDGKSIGKVVLAGFDR